MKERKIGFWAISDGFAHKVVGAQEVSDYDLDVPESAKWFRTLDLAFAQLNEWKEEGAE